MLFTSTRSRVVAVAVAVAAVGGAAIATTTLAQNVQESLDGCRLVDTRAGSVVGPRVGPLGPAETLTVQATGDNGDCTGIPADAEALQIQLTGRFPTSDTFLTVYDADLPARPLISHLNPQASVSTTSNTTVVTLSDTGAFKVYNHSGQVELVIDILGVFSPGDGTPGPQGPEGPQGQPGPQGPQGEPGASFLVTDGPAAFAGSTVGVRYRGTNSGGEVYLGVDDVGVGANRNEANTSWIDGLRPFSLTFDGTTLTSTIAGPGQPPTEETLTFVPTATCGDFDVMQVNIAARKNAGDRSAVENLRINGVPVGGLGPTTDSSADYLPEQINLTVTGEFGDFEISGLLDTVGWGAANVSESNRIEFRIGCS